MSNCGNHVGAYPNACPVCRVEELSERLRTGERYREKFKCGTIAADEIERLTAEHRIQNDCIADQHDKIRGLQARVDALEAGLETFGKHSESCTSVPLFCDCGLLKLKHKALEGERK